MPVSPSASLQDFVTQTLSFFNNRMDSTTGHGTDNGRSLNIRGMNVYTGTIQWESGTNLNDVVFNSWIIGCNLVVEQWGYQHLHSVDSELNFSTVFKFTQLKDPEAADADFDFITRGQISQTASAAWEQAYTAVQSKSPSVRFFASDCTVLWILVQR